MIKRAHRLSSTPTAFSEECDKFRATFLNLDYPVNLINSLRVTNLCAISTAFVRLMKEVHREQRSQICPLRYNYLIYIVARVSCCLPLGLLLSDLFVYATVKAQRVSLTVHYANPAGNAFRSGNERKAKLSERGTKCREEKETREET